MKRYLVPGLAVLLLGCLSGRSDATLSVVPRTPADRPAEVAAPAPAAPADVRRATRVVAPPAAASPPRRKPAERTASAVDPDCTDELAAVSLGVDPAEARERLKRLNCD